MKRAYGLGVTILLIVASSAVALGQAPSKTNSPLENIEIGYLKRN